MFNSIPVQQFISEISLSVMFRTILFPFQLELSQHAISPQIYHTMLEKYNFYSKSEERNITLHDSCAKKLRRKFFNEISPFEYDFEPDLQTDCVNTIIKKMKTIYHRSTKVKSKSYSYNCHSISSKSTYIKSVRNNNCNSVSFKNVKIYPNGI